PLDPAAPKFFDIARDLLIALVDVPDQKAEVSLSRHALDGFEHPGELNGGFGVKDDPDQTRGLAGKLLGGDVRLVSHFVSDPADPLRGLRADARVAAAAVEQHLRGSGA